MYKPACALFILVDLAACRDVPPVVNADRALTAVGELRALPAAMSEMDAFGMLLHLHDLIGANQRIVTPGGEGHRLRGELASARGWSAVRSGSASCSADACSFSHYNIPSIYNTYYLDGTLPRPGDTLDLISRIPTLAGGIFELGDRGIVDFNSDPHRRHDP